MNLIWLMLFITHGGLILVLQSMFRIPCRVCENLRKPMPSEQCIYSENKMRSHVEVVGTCSLVLSSGFILNLENTFYVPSFSRNLISVSKVVHLGYSFSYYETSFNLFYKSNLLEMVHCLMVFSLSICKTIRLITLYMFILVKNDVL